MASLSKVHIVAFALVIAMGSLAGTGTAHGLSGDENQYLGQINGLRSSQGLPGLQVDANLTDLARQHTQSMANANSLFHAGDLTAGVTGDWLKLGENVGMGSNNGLIWNAFLNSAKHYANLVDPKFTHVGIGVVVQGGNQWTTHRFMTLPGSSGPGPGPGPGPSSAPVTTAPPVVRPAVTTATAPRPTNAPRPTSTIAPSPPPTIVDTTIAPPPPSIPPANPERVAAMLDAILQSLR